MMRSSVPARASKLPWDASTWASARICEAVVGVLPGFHVRILGFYGVHESLDKRFLDINDSLLGSMQDHLILSSLPTVILGDFNCDAERLPFCKLLLQRGWQDLAQLWANRTSQPVQPTWLGREGHETRIDFILAPPELVQYFMAFLYNPDSPTDHAEIAATFQFPGCTWHVARWRMPRDATNLLALLNDRLRVPSDLLQTVSQAVEGGSLSQALETFTMVFEGWVAMSHSAQPGLFPLKSFLGRASPSIVKTEMTAPVSGPCRVGDFDVPSDDLPTVGQRLRQVRRLISARHQLARADDSPLALCSFYDTWCAVLRAPGFPVSFSDFAWDNWGIPVPPTPTPAELPLLGLLAHTATQAFTTWHSEWVQAKKNKFAAHVSSSYRNGARALFQSIRPPPRPEISVLEIPIPPEFAGIGTLKVAPLWYLCCNPQNYPTMW